MSIRTPNTSQTGETGGPPTEPRYPWQLFVGMLLAILVGGAILALLLGVNPLTFQKITPGPEATSIAAGPAVSSVATPAARTTPLATSASAPAAAPTAVPTAAPTSTTAPAPQVVQTPNAFSTAQATSIPVSSGVNAGAEPTSGAPEVTPVPADEAQPTPVEAAIPPELAAAIIQGYDNYWSVRVRAMGDPSDTSVDLESVMASNELAAAYETLAQYRDDGEAYEATVHHQIWITRATSNAAEIVDQFTATTIKLDPQTKQPVETTPQVEHITGRFLLQPMDGVWKVVGRAQED